MMEDKVLLGKVDVAFPPVKKGELVITDSKVLLYKKGFIFSRPSLVKHLPLAGIKTVQLVEPHKLIMEGTTDSGEAFSQFVTFTGGAERRKILEHLQKYIEEREKRNKEELEKQARQREKELQGKRESYRKYVRESLWTLWGINSHIYRLWTSIPQSEWGTIKELGAALEKHIETFLKLNGLDKERKIPDLRELSEKEETVELEKGCLYALEYVSGFLGKDAPAAGTRPPDTEDMPPWEALRYFFLYTALLGETGMLLGLRETGGLFEAAHKIGLLAPIVQQKFGFVRDVSVAASLEFPKSDDAASQICGQLVAEVETYLKQCWGE